MLQIGQTILPLMDYWRQ